MKKLVTGGLNQVIQIVDYQNVDDDAAGSIPQEYVYWETNANVTPIKSNSNLQDSQELLMDGFKFIIRFRSDKAITPDMRIKWRGSYLSLISVPTDYVYKEYVEFKATWTDRPVAVPPVVAKVLYFGTSATGDTLTPADILNGTPVPYTSELGISIPFDNSGVLFNWFWVPNGIELPNRYQNINVQDDYGDIGTDQDLFNAFYTVGLGKASMTNYVIPLTDPFLMTKE